MSEIDVSKYFKIYRNDCGFIYAVETVGDERELIKEIRKQNKQLQQLKVENRQLKTELDSYAKMKKVFGQRYTYLSETLSKYKATLDEIEEYCNKYGQNSIGFKKNIQTIIKQAKEGGE